MSLFATRPRLETRPLAELSASTRRALVLDDSEMDRRRLTRMAREADLDMDFTHAATIAEFSSRLDGAAFDVIFLDYRLIQGDGLIALQMVKRHPVQKAAASIMIAGEGQIQIAVDALKGGCSDYIIKDHLSPDVLRRAVTNAIEKDELKASLRAEEDMRNVMQDSLSQFAASCGSEMRTILSSMLRKARAMRRNPGAVSSEDVAGVEASCEKLWNFLEEFQAFVTEAAQAEPRRRSL